MMTTASLEPGGWGGVGCVGTGSQLSPLRVPRPGHWPLPHTQLPACVRAVCREFGGGGEGRGEPATPPAPQGRPSRWLSTRGAGVRAGGLPRAGSWLAMWAAGWEGRDLWAPRGRRGLELGHGSDYMFFEASIMIFKQ